MPLIGPPRPPRGFVLLAPASYAVALDPGLRRPGAAVWRLLHDGEGRRRRVVGAALLGARAGRERGGRSLRDAVVEVARLAEEITGGVISPSVLLARDPPGVVAVASEYPVAYATQRAAHDDVATLRALADVVAFSANDAKVRPSAWKGNAPKPAIERRLRAVFAEEFAAGLVDPEHDAIDALGIGAFALGIVGRGCVALAPAR